MNKQSVNKFGLNKIKLFFLSMLAVVCASAFLLVGCGDNAPNKVTVKAYVYDSTQEAYVQVKSKDVDAHNNLVLDEPTEIPAGKQFYGWSTVQNWEEGSSDFVIEGNYVTFVKVKDVAVNGEVKLYPAFKARINYYFVFGVYTYETRSGIAADDVQAIKTALNTYLQTQQSATAEQLALVDVREYSDSGVADYGAKIMHDGDVDVFVGCGNNINTDGGVSIVAKTGSFTINTKTSRRFILLNYDDLSIAVYNWFQTYIHDTYDSAFVASNFVKVECNVTYALGEHASSTAVAPTGTTVFNNQKITLPDAVAAEEDYIFAGWQVGSDLELKAPGTQVTITESVTITAQFKAGNTVTYANGLATRTAATTTIDPEQNLADGAQVTLPAGPAAKTGFVFAGWRVGAELKQPGEQITVNSDMTVTAEYAVDTTAATTMTIGYYGKTSTSGLTSEIMGNVLAAFKTYLTSVGITTGHDNIVVKAYGDADTNVADAGTLINDDLVDIDNPTTNVGVMLGFGNNLKSTGGVDYEAHGTRQSGFTMGDKTGRYVYKLTDTAISNIIYDWMVADGSTFITAVQTPSA